ncbi:YraN family protein [Humibacter albus]|jgi:putative endonuclease|uniref:YraN family protein n=1 Tax=Humibacter albus TaxID=427754 RepID=UPI0003B52192|nr:YraN family protein [Humibacter albus]
MARKDELGRRGEELATRYLTAHGYRVLSRNWRCSLGEIDVIAERSGLVAIVEVKTRSSLAYGHPFDAITAQKAARLRRLAAQWCQETGEAVRELRIDAIAVLAPAGALDRDVVIEHLTGIC